MKKNRDEIWLKAMDIGHFLGCHQLAERSFFIDGYQFPVCARCTGVILSGIFAWPLIFKKKMPPLNVSAALAEIMLFDWTLQRCKIKESTNLRRLITGFLGGFGCLMIHGKVLTYVKDDIFCHLRQGKD